MASSQYRQGAVFENRVREQFEQAGYYVIRSAGSKGVADLVAFDMMADRITRHPVPVMIQCKRGRNGLGVEAWNHFYTVAEAAGCLAVVAQKKDGRTLDADLWEITGSRTPRGRHKPWIPWPIRNFLVPSTSTDPETGVKVTDTALPGDALPPVPAPLPHGLVRRPHEHIPHDLPSRICTCGHPREDHNLYCCQCPCTGFLEW